MTTPSFEDWLALTDLKARYCRLLDTKEWDSWGALFTDDLVLDTTGSGGPRIEGRAVAVASVMRSLAQARTVHQVHSPEITVDGDGAAAIWAMADRLVWSDGRTLSGHGHYHERYVRADGGWRIAASRLTRLNVELTPPTDA